MAYASKQSSAYRLEEKNGRKVSRQPRMELVPDSRRSRRQAPAVPVGKYVAMAMVVLLAGLCIVYGHMRVNELTVQNDRLKRELVQLQSEGEVLNTKKDQKYNLTYVEQRAKNDLGMVKLDKSSIQYVEVGSPESTTVTPSESVSSTLLNNVADSLSIVVEYLN